MTRSALALAVLAAAVLAGCGDDEAASPGGAPSAGLTAAASDVSAVAPRLESYYRGKDYPRALDAVIASLAGAGVTLAAGNSLGAYRYDADAVEFVLCVENASGAFATYDTAPMRTGESGETGGCPEL